MTAKDTLSPDDLAVAKELLRVSRIWAEGCTNDGFGAKLGQCEECNAAFLQIVAKTIGVASVPNDARGLVNTKVEQDL